jgi:hypothetical protein
LIFAIMNSIEDNPFGHCLNAFYRRFALLHDAVIAEWKANVLVRIECASAVQESALVLNSGTATHRPHRQWKLDT